MVAIKAVKSSIFWSEKLLKGVVTCIGLLRLTILHNEKQNVAARSLITHLRTPEITSNLSRVVEHRSSSVLVHFVIFVDGVMTFSHKERGIKSVSCELMTACQTSPSFAHAMFLPPS